MFLVLKSFASKNISAVKDKTIEIQDKEFAKSLIDGGFITEYSEQNFESTEEIQKLKNIILDLNKKVSDLEEEKANLLIRIKSFSSSNEENSNESENDGNREKTKKKNKSDDK